MISITFARDDDNGDVIASLTAPAVPRQGDHVWLPVDVAGNQVRYVVARVEWNAGRTARSLHVNVMVVPAAGP